jgi:hypothetical protein
MEIKGGSLSATYENGKLIRVIEKYKDVKLPLFVTKAYPGWQIVNEVFVLPKEGDILKKKYNLKIKKEKTSVN